MTDDDKIQELFDRYGKDNPAVKLAELLIERSVFEVMKRAGFMEELLTKSEIDWPAVEELAQHLDEPESV